MKKYIVLGCVIILLSGVVIFLEMSKDTSSGELTSIQKQKDLEQILGRKATLEITAADESWTLHSNKIMSFSYPVRSKVYSEDNQKAMLSPDTLDSFAFGLLSEHLQANILVKNSNGILKLNEISSYQLRLSKPETYKPFDIKIGNINSKGFAKTDDGYEKTAFLIVNGKIISFSVTGYSMEEIDNLFTPLLTSVKIF